MKSEDANRQRDGGRRADGRFGPGNRSGKGRRKGSKNLRTLLGGELMNALLGGESPKLAPVGERLTKLLTDRSPFVRLKAEALVLAYAYGTPRPGSGLTGSNSLPPFTPGKAVFELEWGEAVPRSAGPRRDEDDEDDDFPDDVDPL